MSDPTALTDRDGTTIEVRFDVLPVVPVFEVRHWPSLADTMGCGLCPRCTAQICSDGTAICLAVREDDDGGDGEGDGGPVRGLSASALAFA